MIVILYPDDKRSKITLRNDVCAFGGPFGFACVLLVRGGISLVFFSQSNIFGIPFP
jgi:hypothetical protein